MFFFFNFFSTVKVEIVDEMTYKVLIYVLFYMLSTKKLQSIKSLPKMATIVSDVTGLQQTYHQQSIGTSSCWEDQRLSTEGKIVSKYCKYKKNFGEGFRQPPPTLVPRLGYEFAGASEG